MSDKPVIGFIGLGFMGHGMAKNIRKHGYELWVKGRSNRQPVESLLSMGAKEAASPREMAQRCDIIHICLSNSPQVEGVVHGEDGILAGARPGLIVIDTTTADPGSTLTAGGSAVRQRRAHGRCAAGPHAEGGRGRHAGRHGRLRRGAVRDGQARHRMLGRRRSTGSGR